MHYSKECTGCIYDDCIQCNKSGKQCLKCPCDECVLSGRGKVSNHTSNKYTRYINEFKKGR